MELREALTQIAEIRQQMSRGQIFRGYRAATAAFSAFVALAAGALQTVLVADPGLHPIDFVVLWIAAAAISLAVVGAEMILRTRRLNSPVQRQLTLLAVEQFVPSLAAGGLMTWVFCDFLQGQVWMLPGLWMILFSLGVFASWRLLPREVFGVAGFYLIAGVVTLVVSGAEGRTWAFSPWLMAATFGIGQSATAAILYYQLERRHD